MPLIAAGIAAGGSVLGGLIGSDGARSAARAQERSAREAGNLAYAQYLTSLGLQEPWRASGQSALNELNALFGYAQQPYQSASGLAQQNFAAGQSANTRLTGKAVLRLLKQGKSIDEIAKLGTLRTKGRNITKLVNKYGIDPDDIRTLQAGPLGQMGQSQGQVAEYDGPTGLDVFQASPDYQFRRDEGNRGILNNFGAQDGAFSGNALRALNDFNSNLASGELQNFINRRMQLAGLGHGATNNQQQASQSYGYQGANAIQNAGDARASGIANQANIWGNALSGIGQIGGYAYGQMGRTPDFNPDAYRRHAYDYMNTQFPSYG